MIDRNAAGIGIGLLLRRSTDQRSASPAQHLTIRSAGDDGVDGDGRPAATTERVVVRGPCPAQSRCSSTGPSIGTIVGGTSAPMPAPAYARTPSSPFFPSKRPARRSRRHTRSYRRYAPNARPDERPRPIPVLAQVPSKRPFRRRRRRRYNPARRPSSRRPRARPSRSTSRHLDRARRRVASPARDTTVVEERAEALRPRRGEIARARRHGAGDLGASDVVWSVGPSVDRGVVARGPGVRLWPAPSGRFGPASARSSLQLDATPSKRRATAARGSTRRNAMCSVDRLVENIRLSR